MAWQLTWVQTVTSAVRKLAVTFMSRKEGLYQAFWVSYWTNKTWCGNKTVHVPTDFIVCRDDILEQWYHVSIMCFYLYPVQEHCVHCGPWMQTRPEEDCPPCEKCRIQSKSMQVLPYSTKSESPKLMPPLQVATALLVMQPVSLVLPDFISQPCSTAAR